MIRPVRMIASLNPPRNGLLRILGVFASNEQSTESMIKRSLSDAQQYIDKMNKSNLVTGDIYENVKELAGGCSFSLIKLPLFPDHWHQSVRSWSCSHFWCAITSLWESVVCIVKSSEPSDRAYNEAWLALGGFCAKLFFISVFEK
jgi:hypothetical protein